MNQIKIIASAIFKFKTKTAYLPRINQAECLSHTTKITNIII